MRGQFCPYSKKPLFCQEAGGCGGCEVIVRRLGIYLCQDCRHSFEEPDREIVDEEEFDLCPKCGSEYIRQIRED